MRMIRKAEASVPPSDSSDESSAVSNAEVLDREDVTRKLV